MKPKSRFLFLCGVLAPLVFIFTAILGGAIRPGYNHISETISELFSPGSPNKPFLDILHTTFALLLTAYGVGLLEYFHRKVEFKWIGMGGGMLFTLAGILSIGTAAIFHQDPWGSVPTFQGKMHIVLSGVIGLLSIAAMILIGIWFIRSKVSPRLGIYSFVTAALSILAGIFLASNMGTPIMGLAERLSILVGFQWTFSLAWLLFQKVSGPRLNG